MEAIVDVLGITLQQLTSLIAIGIILVVAWFALRTMLKLTATLFRVGCIAITVIIGGLFLLSLIV